MLVPPFLKEVLLIEAQPVTAAVAAQLPKHQSVVVLASKCVCPNKEQCVAGKEPLVQ